MAKNNGHQNYTESLRIPTPPPPYLGYIPNKNIFFSASLREIRCPALVIYTVDFFLLRLPAVNLTKNKLHFMISY